MSVIAISKTDYNFEKNYEKGKILTKVKSTFMKEYFEETYVNNNGNPILFSLSRNACITCTPDIIMKQFT